MFDLDANRAGTELYAELVRRLIKDPEVAEVFDLEASVIRWNILPCVQVEGYAFNHQIPGPRLHITQGDRVRMDVVDHLPRSTTVHWHGLVVPNIKDAQELSLADLAGAIGALAQTAKDGRTAPADLSGGTISITNVGVFGVDAGTPILNPGEAAILAMGQVRRLPWEHEGQVALRQVMTLSLSFDHRLVDGEQGSRFLADVGAILADPGMVLTMV